MKLVDKLINTDNLKKIAKHLYDHFQELFEGEQTRATTAEDGLQSQIDSARDELDQLSGNALIKTEQSLTDAEKDQVRSNLGYIGRAGVVGEKVTVDGKTYTVEENAEIFGDYAKNKAIGAWSIAEGSENVAVGKASHVEGAMNKAIGTGCHVEGVQCKATGYWSHAEGERTIVTSYASHAEGSYTTLPNGTNRYGTASGYASHVEGGGCHATGSCAHAEGLATTASGSHCHAEGKWTIAASSAQHVEGVANIEDNEGKYIHIAGNGLWDNNTSEAVRSNAYTLDWNGNGWYAGKLSQEGTPENDNDLITKGYIDEKLDVVDAITLNGYSLWVGTTAELEAILERDPSTLYFEIDEGVEDEVVHVNIVDGILQLTNDKYQKTDIIDGTSILFPVVHKFTEIHLYFNTDTDINLKFPECKWRVDPSIEAGKSYEIIATYNTMEWLVNIVVYS